jgi:hypothetical protein
MVKKLPVRFQVLMVTGISVAVFWHVAPCSLVDINLCFRGAYCFHHQGNHPEDSHLQEITCFMDLVIGPAHVSNSDDFYKEEVDW